MSETMIINIIMSSSSFLICY